MSRCKIDAIAGRLGEFKARCHPGNGVISIGQSLHQHRNTATLVQFAYNTQDMPAHPGIWSMSARYQSWNRCLVKLEQGEPHLAREFFIVRFERFDQGWGCLGQVQSPQCFRRQSLNLLVRVAQCLLQISRCRWLASQTQQLCRLGPYLRSPVV